MRTLAWTMGLVLTGLVLGWAAPPATKASLRVLADCACEAQAVTITEPGCACTVAFYNLVVTEGQCTPEPDCSRVTKCKATADVTFSDMLQPCAGTYSLEVQANCRGEASKSAPCVGSTGKAVLALTCAQCTPG